MYYANSTLPKFPPSNETKETMLELIENGKEAGMIFISQRHRHYTIRTNRNDTDRNKENE